MGKPFYQVDGTLGSLIVPDILVSFFLQLRVFLAKKAFIDISRQFMVDFNLRVFFLLANALKGVVVLRRIYLVQRLLRNFMRILILWKQMMASSRYF